MLVVLVALLGLGLASELPEPRVTHLGSEIIEVSFEGNSSASSYPENASSVSDPLDP